MSLSKNHRLTTAVRIAKAANGILVKCRKIPPAYDTKQWDNDAFDHNGVEPMLLALSMEFALKAWFVFDHNDPDVPKLHNLIKLFDKLKPETQHRLNHEFKRSVAPLYPDFSFVDYDLRCLLSLHQDAFIDWRYIYEVNKSLSFSSGTFDTAVEMVLTEFRKLYLEVPVPVLGNRGSE